MIKVPQMSELEISRKLGKFSSSLSCDISKIVANYVSHYDQAQVIYRLNNFYQLLNK